MRTSMNLGRQARELLGWWLEELGQMLRSLGLADDDGGLLQLERHGERVALRPEETGAALPLDGPVPSELRQRLARGPVRLQLDPALVLRRRVELPLAAEEDLRQVLSFEMDRQTPFRAEQVYFDGRPAGRRPGEGRLDVDLVVTPRPAVDAALDWIAAAGGRVRQLGVAGIAGIDLLPADRRGRAATWRSWSRRGLAALAAVLLLVVLAQPLYRDRQRLQWLEAGVAEARAEAVAVQQLRQELEQVAAEAAFVVREKRAAPSALGILDEVTRRVPDEAWLRELEFQGREVRLRGEGPNAARLIEQLEASERFSSPRFRAPVTQKGELEQFHLSAEVTP